MPRSIWKGAIAFGLVHVPVAMYPASQEDDIDFDWLDRRSMDPVGYQRINKRTGKPITKEDIVKGVKQDDGTYVLVDDDEIKAAWPRTMQTIEIEAFVKAADIPVVYFEKPYYLEPAAKAEKVYALLREAMVAQGVVGIARVVMHTKEHLAALMPDGDALVLNTLRWSTEIRDAGQLALPASGKGGPALKETELKMAGQLIDELTRDWKPEEYTDHFAAAIKQLIATKVEAGESRHVTPLEPGGEPGAPSNVVDLTALLRNSLGRKPGSGAASGADAPRATSTRATAPRAAAAKKTGGRGAARPAARKSPAAAPTRAKPAPARKRA
jgi:DNA end-binding protein Ku